MKNSKSETQDIKDKAMQTYRACEAETQEPAYLRVRIAALNTVARTIAHERQTERQDRADRHRDAVRPPVPPSNVQAKRQARA